MGLLSLFEVATMPILQVLLISVLGAFLATDYLNILPLDARRSLNKIVFAVFTPCLMFASLAKTVTFQDIISWWFMPVNIGLTFLFGGILGWIVVKILKPKPYLEGLIIACSASGNLGNLVLIIIPAICNEKGSPFGDRDACSTIGLSYASFSMALGGFYIWTYTYHLVKLSSSKVSDDSSKGDDDGLYSKQAASSNGSSSNMINNGDLQTHLLEGQRRQDEEAQTLPVSHSSSTKSPDEVESQLEHGVVATLDHKGGEGCMLVRFFRSLHHVLEELMAPPTLAAIVGFIFGAIPWLKNLIIGDAAPFRVIQDSVQLLGNGTIPSITLIMGGNLTKGLRSSRVKPLVIMGIIAVRYLMLPGIGIVIVKTANKFGFLPEDPLYQFVLMIQYTMPPAMAISTMTQLFNIAEEECSVIMLWTYLAAALALAVWSALFMWILS